MRKFKRLLKKYSLLFGTFLLVNIFFVAIIINILNIEQEIKIKNSLIGKNAKVLSFKSISEINTNDFMNIMNNKKVILEGELENGTGELASAKILRVFYNYEIGKDYPLAEGRMFTVEEAKGHEKIALVGENLKDKIDDGYILIENNKYKVIGILKGKSDNEIGNSCYINMNSMDFNLNRKSITIDINGESISNVTREINDKFKEANIEIREPIGLESALDVALSGNTTYLLFGALAVVCLISTIINISVYWIESEKIIIGIKRLVGITKRTIIKEVFLEYEFIIIISIICSFIIYTLFNVTKSLNLLIYSKSFITVIIIDVFISILSFIPTVYKISKLNINTIIKEEN